MDDDAQASDDGPMDGVRLGRLVVTAMLNGEDEVAAAALREADRDTLIAALGSTSGTVIGLLTVVAPSKGMTPAGMWEHLAAISRSRFGA